MTHLSLLIESDRVLIVQLSPSASGFTVSKIETIGAKTNIYKEILDKGDPKQLTDCSKIIAEKLGAYSETDISICLNLTDVKSLTARFNRNLNEEAFEEECALEAEAFLREPDEYVTETVKLADEPDAPFENHLLFFVPKRFLTRLQMLFLPSGKNIALVELSHIAVQSLYEAKSQLVILELGEGYLAISKLMSGVPTMFRHWTLEAETDIAYFATNELKALGGTSPVSLFGKLTSESILGFIQDATGLTVQVASLPAGFNIQNEWKKELPLILPLVGCAMKAAEFAE
ncbi:MAG: hypothetical protein SNJ55_13925 [Chloroherpetonaceae bacterium]